MAMSSRQVSRREERLKGLVDEIVHHVSRHCLSWPELDFLLRLQHTRGVSRNSAPDASFSRVRDAAKSVVVQNIVPANVKAFRLFAADFSEILDVHLDLSVFDSTFDEFIKWIKHVVGACLFFFVSYIVVGGVFTSKTGPIGHIMVLAGMIILLGAFEGLQISVTVLRMKTLDGLKSKYPRAFMLHSRFKSVSDTRRFLAGRQLFVIVVVFFAAQITTFPNLSTWPGTETAFPYWMMPWFPLVFLRFGIAGALFVLWFGQLAPQFIATNYPYGFLNIPGMGLVLRLSFLVEAVGLTRPGEWLAAWLPGKQEVPASPREMYNQFTHVLQGFGLLGKRKVWEVHREKVALTYEGSTIILKDTTAAILDGSLEIRGNGTLANFSSELIPADRNNVDRRTTIAEPVVEESLGDGWKRFLQIIRCSQGNFKPMDVVVVRSGFEFSKASADVVHIRYSTKYIAWRVTFHDSPRRCAAKVRVAIVDHALGEEIELERSTLTVQIDDSGDPYVEFIVLYPMLNSYYFLDWEVEY